MDTPVVTRSYQNATLTGPEGTWLTIAVKGEDTPADLTDMSAQLLVIGDQQRSHNSADEHNGEEFATLECNDDVRFTLNGNALETSLALDLISAGIRVALEQALKSTSTGLPSGADTTS